MAHRPRPNCETSPFKRFDIKSHQESRPAVSLIAFFQDCFCSCARLISFPGGRSCNDLRPLGMVTQNAGAEAEGMRAIVRRFYQAINVITISGMLGATNFRIRKYFG